VGEGGFDVVLVRKSGPVQNVKFRSWWIYFLFLILLVMVAGLGAGAYLLYGQQKVLVNLSEDTRLLMLRTERLESLVQEQETRDLLAQQAEDERREAEAAAKAKAKPATKPAEEAKAKEPEEAKPILPPEPKVSEHVKISNVKVAKRGGDLSVVFDVANQHDPNDPAMGYVTVVARAHRAGKPWVEAWPPMRLTPLGRPLNYRRGTPFSVQRYRRLRASFAKGDKQFERLEFLVYSREGQLVLVYNEDLTAKEDQADSQGGNG
jgi:hypothetical protein